MAHTITEQCTGCTACVKICPTQAIAGTKKEQHRIERAFCIDCGVCGKICTSNAVLDAAGAICTPLKKSAWARPNFALDACNGCIECVQVCPVSCLELTRQKRRDKTLYPLLARPRNCIACGFCMEACPMEAITLLPAK